MRATLNHHVLRAGLMAVASAVTLVSVGCSSHHDMDATTRPSLDATTMPTTARVSSNKPARASNVKSPLFASLTPPAEQMVRGSLAYPTGDPKTSAIVLEKAVPAEVISGKPYTYELTVRNVSSTRLENVEIVETIPQGMTLAESIQGANLAVTDDRAHIKVGGLAAGESRTLKVGATATQNGAVTNCASVTYDSSLVLGLNVVSPALTMTKTLPSDVLMCDKVPLKINVTNSGTGTARNVKLEDKLPDGLLTADGKPTVYLTLGDLIAGETKNIEVGLKLTKAGSFSDTSIATADDGLRAEATAAMNVHQAVLELEKSGPRQQYVGVNYTYDIKVINGGDADAQNVTVVDTLPASVVGVEASDGGVISDGKVTWTLPTIGQLAGKQLKLTVKGTEAGTAHNTVSAQADCAVNATVAADTALIGVPQIHVQLLDEEVPVVVGNETTYTILVSNTGSAVATNVRLISDLEPQMEFVSCNGTTQGAAEGKTVTFAPLATLAPKSKVAYTIVVRAKEAGDTRFKATLTSDQLGRPMEELESTTFYK